MYGSNHVIFWKTVKKSVVARAAGEERTDQVEHPGFLGLWAMYDFIVIQAEGVCEVSILSCQFCCERQML